MPILETAGAEVYYEVHGSGPPMLLMSGTACDGDFWKPWQVPEFSRDHTVIIHDQRGIGKTRQRRDDYSTGDLAADAAAIVRRVGLGPAIVIGHSMGGRVAQLVALDHPDVVKKLVLLSSGASYKVKGGIPARIALGIIRLGYERYIREHNIDIGFSKAYAAAHPERVNQLCDVLAKALPSVETYFAHVAARQLHDTAARLKDIRVPCLVTVGEDEGHGLSDTTHRESARVLASEIPGAKFATLKDAGHFYMFSHPQELNGLIRAFLAAS